MSEGRVFGAGEGVFGGTLHDLFAWLAFFVFDSIAVGV